MDPQNRPLTFHTAAATGRGSGSTASVRLQTVDLWAKHFTSQSLREKVKNIQAGESLFKLFLFKAHGCMLVYMWVRVCARTCVLCRGVCVCVQVCRHTLALAHR